MVSFRPSQGVQYWAVSDTYYYINNLTADLHKVTVKPDGTVLADTVLWPNFNGSSPAVYRFGDFAIKDGVLYSSTNGTSGSTAEFFKLDLTTGEYTLISTDAADALALQVSFGTDGTLYGHNAGTGQFYTIDLATGAKTATSYVSPKFSDLASGTQTLYYDFRNQPTVDLAVVKSGPTMALLGDPLTYAYEVTNAGPASVAPVLVDDNGTPFDLSDDVEPTYMSGDANANDLVDPGETWKFAYIYTPLKGTGDFDSFFNNLLTNTVIVSPDPSSGLRDRDLSNNTDTYSIGMWTLRKDVLLYWEGVNVPYADPNTAFTVKLYKKVGETDGVPELEYLATLILKESDPAEMWLSEGSYYVYEENVPVGYTPARSRWFFVENSANRRDMSVENLILFDLAIDKTGPSEVYPGDTVTYDYTLTNAGPAAVTPILSDDNHTPGDTNDDFAPTYVSGDTNGDKLIQSTETWLYTATYTVSADAAPESDIVNVVTVHDKEGEVYEPGHWHLGGDTNLSNNTDTWTVDVLPFSKICGYKYRAGTLTGLPDWTIELYKSDGAGGWVSVDSMVTDVDGKYCFDRLKAGEYKVVEDIQLGWTQKYPASPDEHVITLPDGGTGDVGPELISNGDFELGLIGGGFESEYTTVTVAARPSGGGSLWNEETFAIGSDPWLYHSLWSHVYDHTKGNGTGLMMIVNGNDQPANPLPVVYRTTATVAPDSSYRLSFWGATSYPEAFANMDVYINGMKVGAYSAPSAVALWTPFSAIWNSGDATTAVIELVDTNTTHTGNDFALDDFSLRGWSHYDFFNESAPGISVDKIALQTSVPEPGAQVTYRVRITNTSGWTDPVTINSLTDAIGGAAAFSPALFSNSACTAAQPLGFVVAPGATKDVYFKAPVTGEPGVVNDVVSVLGADDEGTTVGDEDDASVTITNVGPNFTVTKTPAVTEINEPGGDVTMTALVHNSSFEKLYIETAADLSDDPAWKADSLKNLDGSAITFPVEIAAGGNWSFKFVVSVTGEPGAYKDTVSVTGYDNDSTTGVTKTADATVTITNVGPNFTVTKTPAVTEINEPGGDVTMTALVHNSSFEKLYIKTAADLSDDPAWKADSLKNLDDSAITFPVEIAAGGDWSFKFVVSAVGEPGDYDDTVSVTGYDNENASATKTADATVTIKNVLPTVTLDKSAAPSKLPWPGGEFSFTILITNTSPESVEFVLTDTQWAGASGTLAAAGESGDSATFAYPITQTEAGSYDNTAEVTVTDNDGSAASASEDETVEVGQPGYLRAFKYEDANGNQVFDTDEFPVEGWTIQLWKGGQQVGEDMTTDASGEVVFGPLAIGDYTVKEVMRDYWFNTTPTAFDVSVGEGENSYGAMYATAYTAGHPEAVAGESVFFDAYTAGDAGHGARLNPANALGPFDALQTDGNPRMFSVASQTWTDYTFGKKFYNVEGPADIEFAEVTWSRWHVEAAKVYLTGAYVRDAEGNVVPYTATDGGYGYYAGVAWNKEGIQYVSAATRQQVTQSYFMGARDFAQNTFATDGNFGVSQFNLPDEVVWATGVTLVDITGDAVSSAISLRGSIYNLSNNGSTYLAVAGTGKEVIATSLDPFAFAVIGDASGNTDGYDLDAIRVQGPQVQFGNQKMQPKISITKLAEPLEIDEPGGTFTYTFVVKNDGDTPIHIDSVTDSVIGVITLPADVDLLPGESTEAFTGEWAYTIPGEYPNKVTATSTDIFGQTADATADASVEVKDVLPTVTLVKSADVLSMDEPGAFVFTLTITNTSVEDVTIDEFTDTQYDLSSYIGTVLAPDEVLVITYPITHPNPGSYDNDAAITVSDDEGNDASAEDSETVAVSDYAPTPNDILISKTADRPLIPAPGGMVTYTVKIKNLAPEALELTSLTDDKFTDVDLLELAIAANGGSAWLQPNVEITFTFTHYVPGNPETPHKNTVTVEARDDEVTTVTKSDDETVNFFAGSLVTSTSYCQFDFDSSLAGNQFRLVYRPETSNSYVLNGQNPGQFYYNAFVSGAPGDPVDVTLTIPYPFVNHGANPTHIYNGFTISGSEGSYCLGQGPDVSGGFTIETAQHVKSPSGVEVVVLGDYGPQAFGSTTTIHVIGTIPSSGYAYITSHLEYGLIKTNAWKKSGETAYKSTLSDGTFDPASTIEEPMDYWFSSTNSGDALIQSVNEFKKVAGALGQIQGAETYTPKPNVGVELWTGDGKSKVATSITDIDGYFMCIYKYTGKATTFLVKVPSLKLTKTITLKSNGFMIADFDIAGQ